MILYIFLFALVLGEFLVILRLGRVEDAIREQNEGEEDDYYEDGPEPDEFEESIERVTVGYGTFNPYPKGMAPPDDEDEEDRRMIV